MISVILALFVLSGGAGATVDVPMQLSTDTLIYVTCVSGCTATTLPTTLPTSDLGIVTPMREAR